MHRVRVRLLCSTLGMVVFAIVGKRPYVSRNRVAGVQRVPLCSLNVNFCRIGQGLLRLFRKHFLWFITTASILGKNFLTEGVWDFLWQNICKLLILRWRALIDEGEFTCRLLRDLNRLACQLRDRGFI